MTVLTTQLLTITRGVTYSKVVQLSTTPASCIPATWTKMYFTIKEYMDSTDAESVLQIMESNPGVAADGILYLDATAATVTIQAYGSLVIDQPGSRVTIAISDNGTLLLPTGRFGYDIKCLLADGSSQILSESYNCVVGLTETLAV